MADLGFSLIIIFLLAWIIYMFLRLAPTIERRWKVWGEVLAFVIFVLGAILIEVVFSRF